MGFFNSTFGGILSINRIFLTIGDYPLSYIEFVGTLAYFLSVWLMTRKHLLTWPVGIVSVMLFGMLFYQIQLYADTIEQVYFLAISLYGWFMWHKSHQNVPKTAQHDPPHSRVTGSLIPQGIDTQWSSKNSLMMWAGIIALATIVLTYCISHFHVWMPSWFSQPADYPFLDALTTVMSFVAMYLLTIRRNEAWVYWIIVDVIAIGLYWVKGVKFISIQYVFLLVMACYGLHQWHRGSRQHI